MKSKQLPPPPFSQQLKSFQPSTSDVDHDDSAAGSISSFGSKSKVSFVEKQVSSVNSSPVTTPEKDSLVRVDDENEGEEPKTLNGKNKLLDDDANMLFDDNDNVSDIDKKDDSFTAISRSVRKSNKRKTTSTEGTDASFVSAASLPDPDPDPENDFIDASEYIKSPTIIENTNESVDDSNSSPFIENITQPIKLPLKNPDDAGSDHTIFNSKLSNGNAVTPTTTTTPFEFKSLPRREPLTSRKLIPPSNKQEVKNIKVSVLNSATSPSRGIKRSHDSLNSPIKQQQPISLYPVILKNDTESPTKKKELTQLPTNNEEILPPLSSLSTTSIHVNTLNDENNENNENNEILPSSISPLKQIVPTISNEKYNNDKIDSSPSPAPTLQVKENNSPMTKIDKIFQLTKNIFKDRNPTVQNPLNSRKSIEENEENDEGNPAKRQKADNLLSRLMAPTAASAAKNNTIISSKFININNNNDNLNYAYSESPLAKHNNKPLYPIIENNLKVSRSPVKSKPTTAGGKPLSRPGSPIKSSTVSGKSRPASPTKRYNPGFMKSVRRLSNNEKVTENDKQQQQQQQQQQALKMKSTLVDKELNSRIINNNIEKANPFSDVTNMSQQPIRKMNIKDLKNGKKFGNFRVPGSSTRDPRTTTNNNTNNNNNNYNNNSNGNNNKTNLIKQPVTNLRTSTVNKPQYHSIESAVNTEPLRKNQKQTFGLTSVSLDQNDSNRLAYNKSKLMNSKLERQSIERPLPPVPSQQQQSNNNRHKSVLENKQAMRLSTSSQQKRPISKLALPQSNQLQNDYKRRRTDEQNNKPKAVRSSNISRNDKLGMNNSSLYHNDTSSTNNNGGNRQSNVNNNNKFTPMNQSLVKAAVLQHAKTKNGPSALRYSDLKSSNMNGNNQNYSNIHNNESYKKSNVFQSNSSFTRQLQQNNTTTPSSSSYYKQDQQSWASSSNINSNPVPSPTVLPEIYSESEDDDDGSILKDWANSPDLKELLEQQRKIDPDTVFGPIAPLQMEEVFKKSRISRFRARSSSANWSGQDVLTQQEIENYANEMGFKSQNNNK